MLFTASTVKDTLPNVQRFVAGNLAGGVDHLFVFLDAPDPEVRAFLDGHPNVTCVRTDKTWWRGDRPEQLNVRQRINANLTKALLSGVEGADWLFHIDADEIAQIDRAALARVPADTRVVRLAPLEAVSRKHWDGDPTWFKRLLGKNDLILLQTLGVLDKPSNGAYFHGHLDGKAGIRPSPDLWLTLHQPSTTRVGSRRRGTTGASGCCTTSPSPARTSCASGPRSWLPGRPRASVPCASPPRSRSAR